MKKIFCSMCLIVLMLFGAVNCLAAEEDYYIYKNNNFEDHEVGELPIPFSYHHFTSSYYRDRNETYTAEDCIEVVKIEKDGNADNQAAKLGTDKNDSDTLGVARVIMNHYPMKECGVISFSFMVENFELNKQISLNGNMSQNRHVRYFDNKNFYNFITIKGDDVYYRDNRLIVSDIEANTWHRMDFVFDIKSLNAILWFDGQATVVTLPDNTTNISEVQFHLPTTTKDIDSHWYIDDLRIYEAEKIVDDAVLDVQWQRFKDSSFYPSYEFEASRAFLYNYMAFRRSEGKKFFVVNTDKIFDGSNKADLPVKIYEKDDKIIVPIRTVAELYGAKVDWNDAGQKVIIEYGGKTLEVSPNQAIYYINGTAAELDYPVELTDGSACMEIDILFNFLGKEYHAENDIIWLDKPNEFDWHMPVVDGVEINGNQNAMLDECIYDTILRTFLFERPTDEEIDTAIRTYSPDNQHPRVEFTPQSLARVKEGMKTDPRLKNTVEKLIEAADKTIGLELKNDLSYAENRQSYIGTLGESAGVVAAGYLLTDDPEKKAAFKAEIWRYMCHLNNPEVFIDWAMWEHSSLGPGNGAYGLAYAYDWVDWTEEEREILVDMFKRNLFDEAVHAYKCPQFYYTHNITYGEGNQALITSGGFLVLATALYDEDPEYFQDAIRGALHATEGGTLVYFPNGEYSEGISYWRYAGSRFPSVFKSMQTAMGTDWGRLEIPGVLETSTFPFRMRGAVAGYAFGDGQAENAVIPLMMFAADQTDDKTLAQMRKDEMGQAGSVIDVANWVFDTDEYKQGLDIYDTDIMNVSNSTVILKTGWTLADTSVAFHGGGNNDAHGHIDVGSVQFDMNGVRFGMQLPRENYELRDRGHYDERRINEFYPNGRLFEGGHYYRIKGEGHNTVVANRQFTNVQDSKNRPASYDMLPTGRGEFIKTEFSDVSSFAWMDMTTTNNIYQSALRGVKLDKINNILEIQDDFIAETPTDFLWSMHTYAQIEVAEDGKSAILTQSNQKIKATIINDCDFKFEVLPAEFDETYGTSVKPHFESPNFVYGKDHPFYQLHLRECDVNQDARKLAVRTKKGEDIDHFRLAVTFQPYIEGNTPVAEYTPLELWENKAVQRQKLASVTIDGKPLDAFDPNKFNVAIQVITEKSDIPVIEGIPANNKVQVETIGATTIPGATNLILKQDGVTVGQYTFIISPINNTEKFHTDKQLPVVAYTVSSEPESQNGVANLFDGDFKTKFATNEQGGNVVIDLGSVIEGNLKLNISCASGNKRTENFKIEHSVDGYNYTEVFNGHNSGTTTGLEQFDICNKARYVKVSFYGSSQGSYVSVTELFVSNE